MMFTRPDMYFFVCRLFIWFVAYLPYINSIVSVFCLFYADGFRQVF